MLAQRLQKPRRGGESLVRIERIAQADLGGDLGHELGDALRAGATDREEIETALLPDQIGEEGHRQIVIFCGGEERMAQRADRSTAAGIDVRARRRRHPRLERRFLLAVRCFR